MTILLLIAMVFSDGDAGTLAIRFQTPEECFKAVETMNEKVVAHNTTQPVKVTEIAMQCVQTKKAPQGQGT